jgi:hypothetical protein
MDEELRQRLDVLETKLDEVSERLRLFSLILGFQDGDELLSVVLGVSEAAQYLGVTDEKLRAHIAAGKVATLKGGVSRIALDRLDKSIRNKRSRETTMYGRTKGRK